MDVGKSELLTVPMRTGNAAHAAYLAQREHPARRIVNTALGT